MRVTFYGAAREVTGSMHLLQTKSDQILLDCGLFQGRRKETEQKNRTIPIDPRDVTNMVLSHGHIDHSGRVPMLPQAGYGGRVISTRASHDVSEFLLMDAAHIQESDAHYLNYKTLRSFLNQPQNKRRGKTGGKKRPREIKKLLKKNNHRLNSELINQLIEENDLEAVQPLFTTEEAASSLKLFDSYPYKYPVTIGRDVSVTFYDAGHILGSALSLIKVRQDGRVYNICYTGDIGQFDLPIIEDPTLDFPIEDRELDLLIMESTYGDRLHGQRTDLNERLCEVIVETFDRGGTVVIPSFAFGRTQELIYVLHELYKQKKVPRIPVYIDSPLATNLTSVFGSHLEVFDREAHETFLEQGENPFSFGQIQYVGSVNESMALMRDERPHIVIASSGMCEAGRILHHLRYKVHDEKNTILIVGFMAANTLGRKIQESGLAYEESGRTGSPPELKILNKMYPLNARVVKLDGFSAHADKDELLCFVKESNLKIKKIAVVHGEETQSLALARSLEDENFSTIVPQSGETIQID